MKLQNIQIFNLLLTLFLRFLSAQTFTDIGDVLPGFEDGAASWVDYDQDGDLDVCIRGYGGKLQGIYRNNNSQFTFSWGFASSEGPPPAWGDYDNDGFIDMLLNGIWGAPSVRLYHNNGSGGFTEIQLNLSDDPFTIAWGDFDNDGDLDILESNVNNLQPNAKLLENQGLNIFNEMINRNLIGSKWVVWGDYDNDRDLDILITDNAHSTVLRNDKGIFTNIMANTMGSDHFGAVWGDYDADGDLDIVIIKGYSTKLYRNDQNDIFTEVIGHNIPGYFAGSVAWGDCDNDGDLDLAIAGVDSNWVQFTKIFRNQGNDIFTEINTNLSGVYFGSVAWGDYDRDGDLDLLIMGREYPYSIAKIYRNDGIPANTLPSAPTNLSSQTQASTVMLDWNIAYDVETPAAGLTYNLRVGISPGGNEIVTPMISSTNGRRLIPVIGNVNQNLGWILKNLSNGTYYWSVQAVDNSFDVSGFAPEQTFTVQDTNLSWINSVYPTPNSLNALYDTGISASFKEDLNPISLNINTIKIKGSLQGSYNISNISYNSSTRIINFTTNHTFIAGEIINITLTTGIENNTGQEMPLPFTWQFTVRSDSSVVAFRPMLSLSVTNNPLKILSGDFNGNGYPDLAVLMNGFPGKATIFVNNGNGQFSEHQNLGFSNEIDIGATGDWNGDGYLDFVVVCPSTRLMSILMNNGSAYFTEISIITVLPYPKDIAAGDFDGDGDTDLALVIENQVSIYMNDGAGNFSETSRPTVSGSTRDNPTSIKVADWDNDGDLDLFILDYHSKSVSILNNDGTGTFRTLFVIGVSNYPGGFGVGDIDGDNDVDLVVGIHYGELEIFINNGEEGFSPGNITVNMPPLSGTKIQLADLNGDQRMDCIIYQNGMLHFLINDGGYNFHSYLIGTEGADRSIVCADFNRDGDVDLAGCDWSNKKITLFENEPYVSIDIPNWVAFGIVTPGDTKVRSLKIFNHGIGAVLHIDNIIPSSPAFVTTVSTDSIAAGDSLEIGISFTPVSFQRYHDSLTVWSDDQLNREAIIYLDGVGSQVNALTPSQNAIDIASDTEIQVSFDVEIDSSTLSNASIRLNGSQLGQYTSNSIQYNSASQTVTYVPDHLFMAGEVITASLTKQILTSTSDSLRNPFNWSFTVEASRGTGGLFNSQHLSIGNSPVSITSGDFDNDEDIDLAIVNSLSNNVSILLNNGSGNFALYQNVLVGDHPVAITSGDFDEDTDIDLAVVNDEDIKFSVLLNDGNAGFFETFTPTVPLGEIAICSADYNGDGHIDLAIGNQIDATISVWLNTGGGQFNWFFETAVGSSPQYIVSGDFDNDGMRDLAVGTSGSSKSIGVSIFRNNGEGKFDLSSVLISGNWTGRIAIADLNADGYLDLVTRSGEIIIWLNDQAGNFIRYQSLFNLLHQPHDIVLSDFDADGDLDLAIAMGEIAKIVRFFVNDGNGYFTHYSTSRVELDAFGLNSADFDGDGSLDLAVTNLGDHSLSVLLNGGLVSIDENLSIQPQEFTLYQNYPNPFNPNTTIKYALKKPTRVILKIYTVLGQEVKTLINEIQPTGVKSVIWDGRNNANELVSSGIYLYSIKAGDFRQTKKLLLFK